MSALPKRFPDRVDVAAVRAEADALEPGAEWTRTRRLAGRVMARRDMGKLVFLDLVDRSGRIQLFCQPAEIGELHVDLGDIVGVEGRRPRRAAASRRSRRGQLELLAKIKRPLPDTFHGLQDVELRYRKRYLDLLMTPETRGDFLLRARMVTAIRALPGRPRFVEVETPILQPRYGGGFAEPFVTHSHELDRTSTCASRPSSTSSG